MTHMTILLIVTWMVNLWNQSCQSFVTCSSPFSDCSCKFVDRPCNVWSSKFVPNASTLRRSACDNSPTDSSSSCLNWWSSKQGLETWQNCSTFLFANSQYRSTHFRACPSMSQDHATVFAWGFSHPGNFPVAPAEIRDSNIFVYSLLLSIHILANLSHNASWATSLMALEWKTNQWCVALCSQFYSRLWSPPENSSRHLTRRFQGDRIPSGTPSCMLHVLDSTWVETQPNIQLYALTVFFANVNRKFPRPHSIGDIAQVEFKMWIGFLSSVTERQCPDAEAETRFRRPHEWSR